MEYTGLKWWYEEDPLQEAISKEECKKLGMEPPKFKHISVHGTYPSGILVAYCGAHEETEANARHIVKCVNNFDGLLEVCKAIYAQDESDDFLNDTNLRNLEAALAAAESED